MRKGSQLNYGGSSVDPANVVLGTPKAANGMLQNVESIREAVVDCRVIVSSIIGTLYGEGDESNGEKAGAARTIDSLLYDCCTEVSALRASLEYIEKRLDNSKPIKIKERV